MANKKVMDMLEKMHVLKDSMVSLNDDAGAHTCIYMLIQQSCKDVGMDPVEMAHIVAEVFDEQYKEG